MTVRRFISLVILTGLVILATGSVIYVLLLDQTPWRRPAKDERSAPGPPLARRALTKPDEIILPAMKHVNPETIAAFQKQFGKVGYGAWAKSGHEIQFFLDALTPVHDLKVGIPGFELFRIPDSPLPEVAEEFGLNLGGKDITDEVLSHICKSTNVVMLVLDRTKITDNGLRELKNLQKLQVLALRDTNISDPGLKHLAELRRLKVLYLDNAKVTDDGVKHLFSLHNLECLSLTGTKITDAAMNDLANMERLNFLYLCNTQITDAGLKDYLQTGNPLFIDLRDAKISNHGRAEFRKLRPGCLVYPEW
ncbi:MAG: hypothetical protein EXS16_16355 [Gemmataceae bacterium]|nr:hypothetical protein [Gemmataceae bacterium]